MPGQLYSASKFFLPITCALFLKLSLVQTPPAFQTQSCLVSIPLFKSSQILSVWFSFDTPFQI